MARARVNSYGVSGRSADVASPTRWATVAAVACCGALLCVFAVTSWAAVMRKSAAVDEPTRAVAAWMHLARGDFRAENEPRVLLLIFRGRFRVRRILREEATERVDAATGEPAPYLHVRGGLEALIDRKSFYRLVEIGEEHEIDGRTQFGVWSAGTFFPFIAADALVLSLQS